jgi:hypothetical protein
MRSTPRLAVLAALGLLAGCAGQRRPPNTAMEDGWLVRKVRLHGPHGEGTLEIRYRTGDLGAGWEPSTTPPGDLAWYHPALGTTVYADSSCGQSFDDAPLAALANHLTAGFTRVKVLDRQDLELADRAALERTVAGELDGVPMVMTLTIIKKGPCVFDLVAVGEPKGQGRAMDDYRRFRDGFDVRMSR